MKCIELKQENFERTLAEHAGIIVMFGRENCLPCREKKQPFYDYAESSDRAFGYVDVLAYPELESRCAIEGVPAFASFNEQQEKIYCVHSLKKMQQDVEQGNI